MTQTVRPELEGWRYGIHPHAAGMRVLSLERVELGLGEALRLELASDAPGESDIANVQYYISTEAGHWALWLSRPRAELADSEASLQGLTYTLAEQPQG
jgi:hypothetical protein